MQYEMSRFYTSLTGWGPLLQDVYQPYKIPKGIKSVHLIASPALCAGVTKYV